MSMVVVVGLLFLLGTAHVLSEVNGGNHHAQYCIENKKEALLSFKGYVDLGNTTELSEGFGLNHKARCIEKEKEALLSFKRVVDPANILSSWANSTNQNCCNWRGVTCDNQTNHVIKLDFSDVYDHDNKTDAHDWAIIGGEIGSSLVELQYLKYLDLSRHGFGRIPKFIGSFKELMYLSLAWNPISGTIPPELGNLTKLEFLDLASDSDHDQMIVDNLEWLSRLTSLRTFRLMHTKFTKAGLQSFKLPPFLSSLEVSNCRLPEVHVLEMRHCSILQMQLVTMDVMMKKVENGLTCHGFMLALELDSPLDFVEFVGIFGSNTSSRNAYFRFMHNWLSFMIIAKGGCIKEKANLAHTEERA